jgi:hypothetical protein
MSVVAHMSDHRRSDLLSNKAILAHRLSLRRQDAFLDALSKRNNLSSTMGLATAGAANSGLVSHLRASSASARGESSSPRHSLVGGSPLPSPQHLRRAIVAPPPSSSSSSVSSSSGNNSNSTKISHNDAKAATTLEAASSLSPFLASSLLSPQASMIEALAASSAAADARLMFSTANSSSLLSSIANSAWGGNRWPVAPSLASEAFLAHQRQQNHARLLPSASSSVTDALFLNRLASQNATMATLLGFNKHPFSALASSVGRSGTPPPRKTRDPVVLFMECDEDSLSEYQCLIRKQMELFEANAEEAACSVQGRNKQVVEGQVGIRCRHCCSATGKDGKALPVKERPKGSMYFP